MMRLVRWLGSVRLALIGMTLLGIGAALNYGNPTDTSIWVLVAPLALLAVNLLVAILTNPRIYRRYYLLFFHIGLLGIVVLAAIGRLTIFEGRIELVQGSQFNMDEVLDIKSGPWHNGDLPNVVFVQGRYTVDYSPGMIRGLTHNEVLMPDGAGGWKAKIIGDDRPLVQEGYRFYTSFNKGFAPVLTWIPDNGQPVTGTLNMPSYPMFEYKQDNRWIPPGSSEIKFWLSLKTGLRNDAAWVLDGDRAEGTLVINTGKDRIELNEGESTSLPGGTLRYEKLTTWMGYRIFYDPTLKPLFWVSVLSVCSLFMHFWQKIGLRLSLNEESRPLVQANTSVGHDESMLESTIKPNSATFSATSRGTL